MDTHALLTIVALVLAGAVVGWLGGLMGIGGGLFAIPLLGLAFGLDEQHAQGTSLVMVVPNVAVALWNYARKSSIDKRIALTLAASALPLTIVGAHVATHLPSRPLRISFAIFTLCVGAYMAYRALAPASPGVAQRRSAPWPFATLVGAFGGMLSGLFSVGGAVFAVPLLAFLFGLSQAAAQGFGLALVAPGTLAGIATYAWAGDVDWAAGIPLAVGGVLTVPAGVRLAHRLPERKLQLAFAGLMMLSAAALFARAG